MTGMNYSDTVEKSSEYLRLVLKFLGIYDLPADPLNYRLWYEHVAGLNAQLSQAIEQQINEKQPITPTVCRDLYSNYISDSNKLMIDNIRNRIQHILTELLRQILNSGSDFNHYSEKLESFTEQLLQENADTDNIKQLIQDVISETRSMENASKGLKNSLQSISGEVESLREDLEKARQQATTDALTGLANRRAFDEALAKETLAARNSGHELSLLIADIDQFKRINDNFGHLVGDKVLVGTADLIRECVKGRDFVARFGGEEFVVLLPETDLTGAHTVAEKIRQGFELLDWRQKRIHQNIAPVTISVGIANYAAGESWENFIQRADRALYFCKNEGRNQVASCSA